MSDDQLEVVPDDLVQMSRVAAEAGRVLDTSSGPQAPVGGAFGAVTHSSLVEQIVARFAETDIEARLRSSVADAAHLAETLSLAADEYRRQDTCSGRRVCSAVSDVPEG
ncbi:MAG: type VII secretion target [Dermatophilaceae bacterium]